MEINNTDLPKFDVCVVGLGYVGLPTAALFAEAGLKVCGVDNNPNRLKCLANGETNSGEDNLDEILSSVLESSNLKLNDQPLPADNFLVCVPTPVGISRNFVSDAVEEAVKDIAGVVQKGDLIVLESTCPPGTTEYLLERVREMREDLRGSEAVMAAHCPERVLPGNTVEELRNNSRIVGGCSPRASEKAEALFTQICKGPIRLTDSRTAEMTKLVENTFRDVNIALANELSMICDFLDVSNDDVRELANMHPRVNLHQSGIGVGGHCISVDPWFIVDRAPELSKLIPCARQVNDDKTQWVSKKLIQRIQDEEVNTVRLWGLSYKPDTGDLRNSPAVIIAAELVKQLPQVNFYGYDPYVSEKQLGFQQSPNFFFQSEEQKDSEYGMNILLVKHQKFKRQREEFDVDATSI